MSELRDKLLARALELIGYAPGDRWIEAMLHRRFAADRVHREWFAATPRLEKFIEGVLACRKSR